MPPWHEDDEWWRITEDLIFGLDAWERAPREVEALLALVGREPPLRVLDLPCGVGRHTLELARRGCAVTGVDRTARYLDAARSRASDLALHVELIQDDMRAFARPSEFDLVVNLLTSFGYFEDPAEDRQVLSNFLASLKPGGALVMELMGREVLARIFRRRDWQELPDGTLVLEEREVCRDWSWLENRWIFIRGTERHDLPLSHRLYGGLELKCLLEECGFVHVRLCGDLLGSAYGQDARRLVAVAQKPSA